MLCVLHGEMFFTLGNEFIGSCFKVDFNYLLHFVCDSNVIYDQMSKYIIVVDVDNW